MPRLNGAELIRQLRAIDGTLPILVMTGYRGMLPDNTEELLGDAGVTILEKPLTLGRVQEEIERLAGAA